jgi:uncharacterized membrane protein
LNSSTALALAFGIGVVTGLRSMTGPAVVAWAAHMGVLHLAGTRLSFMGSTWGVAIFTLAALGEYVADQLPSTPARTQAMGLSARIVMGALCGACVGLAAGTSSPWPGAVTGAVGAVGGAFTGFYARTGLVRSLKVKDILIAIPEDLVAIALGALIVTRL